MIPIEVEFVSDDRMFVQFTSVPVSLSVTGLIRSLDISGRLPETEILENVNMIEFTSK